MGNEPNATWFVFAQSQLCMKCKRENERWTTTILENLVCETWNKIEMNKKNLSIIAEDAKWIEQWPEGKYTVLTQTHTHTLVLARIRTQSSAIWSKAILREYFQRLLLFFFSCRWHFSCLLSSFFECCLFSHPSLFFGSLLCFSLLFVCLLVC